MTVDHDQLRAADDYFDAVPRSDAEAIEVGAFTLFVGRGPWPYYARPTRAHTTPPTVADLVALRAECERRGIRTEIEWVHELQPGLGPLAREHGFEVHEYALMVAETHAVSAGSGAPRAQVTILDPEDEDAAQLLRLTRAVADVSFRCGGTGIGTQGAAERDELAHATPAATVDHLLARARLGRTVTAVAIVADGPVATGSYQPVGDRAEIVGMATLPAARRQGLAAALTRALAVHADSHGVTTLLLSAENDDVARVYAGVGFTRVGTAMAASPAAE